MFQLIRFFTSKQVNKFMKHQKSRIESEALGVTSLGGIRECR